MVVQLLDDQKNTHGGNSARLPKISYACPKLHVNPVAGQSARWETVDGVHLLKLPLLVITPNTAEEGLRIGHADQSVKCEVTVGFSNLSRHQSPTAQVSINFVVNVVSGNRLVHVCIARPFLVALYVHPLLLPLLTHGQLKPFCGYKNTSFKCFDLLQVLQCHCASNLCLHTSVSQMSILQNGLRISVHV